ncbi:hypothetical protein [Streptomyces sp. NRRL S-37]|uniref:hypothetical protein n=1 Tax=Streptomyces sp. NRRL S-37 TaxID=1463903 RepID=UPI0004C80ABB|nr:hypothetical protein [Streptomyces sp. NRRL S-37]
MPAAWALELTALTRPNPEHALELARWADPRATTFFFRSRSVPAWLVLLQEHASHLLLPDSPAGVWLAEHAEAVAGWSALDALLHLAGRDTSMVPLALALALALALVRTVLARQAADRPAGEPVSPQEGVDDAPGGRVGGGGAPAGEGP